MVVAVDSSEPLNFGIKFVQVRILLQLFEEVGRELIRQAILVKLFEALKIFDMARVAFLVSKAGLAVDGRAVRHVTLTEDSRVGLCEVLRAFNRGVSP